MIMSYLCQALKPVVLITRNGLRIKVRNPRNYDVAISNQNDRNVEKL
jgi:hypothetical protein